MSLMFLVGGLTHVFLLYPDGDATASPHIGTAIQDHTTSPVITQTSQHHNGDVAKPDLKIQVPGAVDGDESEDSAMLESPVSEAA